MTKQNDNIKQQQGQGRPASSRDFRTVAVPNDKPDLRKLGRALLALATHLANKDEVTEGSDDDAA
jgi:hypothetical protein